MSFEVHRDPLRFKKIAFSTYEKNPSLNGYVVSKIEEIISAKRHQEYLFLNECNVVIPKTLVVSVQNHPMHVYFESENRIHEVIKIIKNEFYKFESICGDIKSVDLFSRFWTEFNKVSIKDKMHQGVLECNRVKMPGRPEGNWIIAEKEKHEELILNWTKKFVMECKIPYFEEEIIKSVAANIKEKNYFLWLLRDNPVSLCGVSMGKGVIGSVYTPLEYRGKGYGSSLTAIATDKLLKINPLVYLYTDLKNKTSNRIYENIGYSKTGESAMLSFY